VDLGSGFSRSGLLVFPRDQLVFSLDILDPDFQGIGSVFRLYRLLRIDRTKMHQDFF
jgi:hypothetical protein